MRNKIIIDFRVNWQLTRNSFVYEIKLVIYRFTDCRWSTFAIYLKLVTIYTILHADKGRNKSHLLPAHFTGRSLDLRKPSLYATFKYRFFFYDNYYFNNSFNRISFDITCTNEFLLKLLSFLYHHRKTVLIILFPKYRKFHFVIKSCLLVAHFKNGNASDFMKSRFVYRNLSH